MHQDTPLAQPRETLMKTEEFVAYIVRNAVPKAMRLEEVESATASDPLLQAVMNAMRTGKWHNPEPSVSVAELSRFEQVKDQLTCTESVLLKSNRLVVPSSLQDRTVDIAHEGYLGIVKEKPY